MTEKPSYEELEKKIQKLEKSESDRTRMENVLRGSEERYRGFFIDNHFVILLIDPENANIVDANPAALSYYGWSFEEITKKKITDINILLNEKIFQKMEGAKKGQQQFFFRHCLSNGEIRDVEVFSGPITVDGKELLYSIVHDLSKRKQREEALNETKQYARGLIEANLDALVTISVEGKITDVNKASELITGMVREEIIGTDFSNYFTDPDAARRGYQQVFRDGTVRDYPLEIKHLDGKVTPVLYNASVYKDAQGNVAGVFAAARDITELKKAAEVKSARDYLEKLTSSMWDAVFSIRMPERVIEWANDSFRLIGYEPIEYIGKTTSFLYADTDAFFSFGNRLKEAIAVGKEVLHSEELLKRKSGVIFTAEIIATFNRENNEVISVTSMIRDITQRKQTELALKVSEERLNLAIKAAGIGLWDWNIKTGETVFNERWAAIIGYNLEELSPISIDTWNSFCHPDDLKKSNGLLEKHFARKTDYYRCEVRMRHKDGHWVWVLDQGRVFEWSREGKALRATGTHIDISDSKLAMDKLKESKETLVQAIQGNSLPTFVIDSHHIITHWNRACESLTGLLATEIIGTKKQWSAFYPSERSVLADFIVDGSTEQEIKERYGEQIQKSKLNEDAYECETFYPDLGKKGKWLFYTAAPLKNRDGIITGAIETFQDTTERKNTEAQYHQAQKMESVGRLAGGVAHDFNNALSVIISTAELAIDDVNPTGQLREDLGEIFMAGKRAADITRQLLAFARKQTIAPKVLDLNDTVGNMLKMLRRLIGEDIDLAWLPGEGLWSVKIDPSQIDQILANLCVNARDAIEGVGKVTIELENVIFDEDYCADHVGFVSGEFILLSVSDNGCGMNKEILDNIFEPFFTTKEVDRGTGLGMAMVYGIAKQNEGFINVYSEPNKGTTVECYAKLT